MDYAIINLNSVLEAEAAQRRRMHERGVPPDAPEARGGVQVVVIDAQGRAQTLNTRDMGPRFLDELMEREAARYQLDRGMVLGPDGHLRYEEDLRLTSDIERVYANAQFRFWLRVVLTLLSCFLVLYVVVAIIAASDSSSNDSLPVFLFRLFGFTLPLVLTRARRRVQAATGGGHRAPHERDFRRPRRRGVATKKGRTRTTTEGEKSLRRLRGGGARAAAAPAPTSRGALIEAGETTRLLFVSVLLVISVVEVP